MCWLAIAAVHPALGRRRRGLALAVATGAFILIPTAASAEAPGAAAPAPAPAAAPAPPPAALEDWSAREVWLLVPVGDAAGTPEALEALRSAIAGARPEVVLPLPAEIALRARAADDAAGGLARARALLDDARSHRLRLESALAVASSRSALAAAAGTLVFFHARHELADMTLQTAAAELEATRPVQARATLLDALRVDPLLEVDPGRFSPELVALYREAKRYGVDHARSPTDAELKLLGRSLDVARILVVSVERAGGAATLRVVVYDPAAGAYTSVHSTLLGADVAAAGATIARELEPAPTHATGAVPVPPDPAGGGPTPPFLTAVPPRPPKPLWRRAAFWTGLGAGGLAVAAAIIIPASLLGGRAVLDLDLVMP